jgi:hypothetical protein
MALQGVALGGAGLLWMLGNMDFAEEKDVPLYMGINATLTGLRGSIGPLFGVGFLQLLTLRASFVLGGIGMLATAGLMLAAGRPRRASARGRGVESREATR